MLLHLTDRICPPILVPCPAATAVIDGQGDVWTERHSDWWRGAVVQPFKAICLCIHEQFGLIDVTTSGHWSSVHYLHGAGPIHQGHLPDDFRRAAYNHVRSSPFLTDTLTSWVLIWGCVLYIGLQIFTLWQKSKVGVHIIFDGILYSKFYGMQKAAGQLDQLY